jgi:phage anti-repressor protein/very-short-patch-repair endonuclease
MLQINERNRVYGEEIHRAVESKNKNYRDWLNDKIQYADLQEGKDFFAAQLKSTGGRPKTQYELTINAIKKICLVERTKKAKLLYKHICELDGIEVLYEPKTRKELLFEINLIELLDGVTKIIPQYSVLDYRIDFYLPDLKIAIEYDEKHHNSKKKQDEDRQKQIQEVLKCDFIRVDEYFELKAINELIKIVLLKTLVEYQRTNDFSMFGEEFFEVVKSFKVRTYEDILNEGFMAILNGCNK